jgi:hypothetical protein
VNADPHKRTKVSANDVTAVIAEHCDTHQTGLLLIDTGNVGLLLLSTHPTLSAGFHKEAESLADALEVPLISREGCSF